MVEAMDSPRETVCDGAPHPRTETAPARRRLPLGMSRKEALLLAALVLGCASATALAVRKPKVAPDPTIGGAPVSSAASLAGDAPVPRTYEKKVALPPKNLREDAPGFAKARGWLNVTRTPKAEDLRGRVVVVDFWTSCCINCMHALPTLAKLEALHKKDPVIVVGVHTQKFDAEPEPARLRASVIRYGVQHPVAIDGDKGIWEGWGVSAWPTIMVMDAKGRIVWEQGGEPNLADLDAVVESTLAEGAEEGALAKEPVGFLGKEVDPARPLAFPEKIVALANGDLLVADSGHDRLVLTDASGKVVATIGDGQRGFVDGTFEKARFAHPQGIAVLGELIYVADTENHAIRAIDRKARTVTTVAGTGVLGNGRLGKESLPAKTTALRSPWDLAVVGGTLYVALAGSHQIATLDPKSSTIQLFAGSGAENRSDGSRLAATFAQPSGLATDGKDLFVLDSETSSVRKIALATGEVTTLVGKALFVWGDLDGPGDKARLQHPIGLAYGGGALYVADTYNNKIKRIDPATGETKTVAGGFGLSEPAGLVYVDGNLLVADTNSGRIAKVTHKGEVSPFPLAGL